MKEKKQKGKKHHFLALKIIFFLLAVLLILFAGFYLYMKNQTNPQKTARQYVQTFISKDTDSLFALYGFKTDTFLTPQKLAASLEECHKYSELTTESMVPLAEGSDENTQKYTVKYWTDYHLNAYTQTLILKKSSEKLYFLFDKWDIDNSDLISKECTLFAPSGAVVKVDDIELTSDMITDSSNTDTVIYNLGDMFIGTHTLSVTMDGFNEYTSSVFISKDRNKKAPIYSITPSMLSVSAETEKVLKNTAKKLIHSIYNSALKKKTFQSLADTYKFEESSKTLLEQKYNTLVNNNINSNTHLTDVKFHECSMTSSSTATNDGCYGYNILADIGYTSSSIVKKEKISEETGLKVNSTHYRSGSSNSLFTIYFHFKNGNWTIYDTTALDACIYYLKI